MTGKDRESDRESRQGESRPSISFDRPVTLVGGGDLRRETLSRALEVAPSLVAADGGANQLRAWGLAATAVVGDMDSIAEPGFWRRSGATFLCEEEQNSTDLEKCLRLVQAPMYLAVGFLGGRLDHAQAAMGITSSRVTCPVILVGDEDVLFPAPLAWETLLPDGARLSILATRRVRVVESTGLFWTPDDLVFDLGSTRGVSNFVENGKVQIVFDRPGALLVLEIDHLGEVVKSLRTESASDRT